MQCLTTETILAVAHGELDEASRTRCEGHAESCPACATALGSARAEASLFAEVRDAVRSAVPESDPPPVIDEGAITGYRLLRELHRGGQGVVFVARARDDAEERDRALKVLAFGPWTGLGERHRFEREIALARRLDHPDIVPVEDSGAESGWLYYTMPLIEGEHLDRWVEREAPARRQRLNLFLRITRAVAHAHRRGVLHRDLKPANILIDRSGAPKLLDFGVGKSVGGDTSDGRTTRAGHFLGTPAYASPEQLRADPDVSTASDVYALGVLFFEMLTGKLPHDATGSLADVAKRRSDRDVVIPARVGDARLDEGLRSVLARALARRPEDRYPTADGLADDVARLIEGRPPEAAGIPRLVRLAHFTRRHRRALAGAATLLIVLVVAAGISFSFHLREVSQRDTAQQIETVLREMVEAASPDRMGGGAPILGLLDQVAERLRTTLADAPDVQAAVRSTLGDTYRRLYLMAEAQPHLEAALARYRAVDDARQLEVAKTLHRLGLVLSYRSDRAAVSVLEEALLIRRRELGDRDPLTAECERALGFAFVREDVEGPRRLERAEELLGRALETFARARPVDQREVARCHHRLGQLWTVRGDRTRAEVSFAAALSAFRSHDGEDAALVECLGDFASLLAGAGCFERAEQLVVRASEVSRRCFGDERAAEVFRAFARLAFERGDYEASERHSLRAVAAKLAFWARRRPERNLDLAGIAATLERGDLGDAAVADALVDGFRRLREFHGRGAFELASWLGGLDQICRQRGRIDLADRLTEEALTFDCRVFGDDCPIRLGALERLARSLAERDAPRRALDLVEEALAIRARTGREEGAAAALALAETCRQALAGEGPR